MKLNCVVVDDEPLAIGVLKNYIENADSLTLVASFNNGIDALEYLDQNKVDILFLDIQMPDMSGMELLKKLDKKPCIIFTSAYPQYALEGYDYQPVDFLLKPIPQEKFLRSIRRVTDLYEGKQMERAEIFIKSKGQSVRLPFSEIVCIEGLKDYVKILTLESMHITQLSMKELEATLPKRFIRVHKSFMVDSQKIVSVKGNEIHVSGKIIPIGRQYKSSFTQLFAEHQARL